MELLTGKAKEDFLNYYWENHINNLPMTICKRNDLEEFFNSLYELFQNTLIIEWLDSVGVYAIIEHQRTLNSFVCEVDAFVKLKTDLSVHKTRQEATTEAIKKANEIYNNQ